MNAAQALFHYKHSPAHRATTPTFYAPSTPAPYITPGSPALSLSPSPASPSPPLLATQLPLTADAQVLALPAPMPKARNAFIIFRSHYITSGQAKGVRLQNDISRLAAETWRGMSDDEKEEWREKAAEEKKERGDMAKAIEMGYMTSQFVNMSTRPTSGSKKAQQKKERSKAAAIAAALKKQNDSAKKAEKRKADAKKSPVSPSQTSIRLPELIHGPLVRPESVSSPSIYAQGSCSIILQTPSPVVPPSSLVSSLEPYIVDPYTFQSHMYDSPLDSEQRTASPSPANFQRVAGAIQVIEPGTRTFLAPSLPPLGEFQASIENPWLGNRNMFAGAQRVPVQTPAQNIQLSRVMRESALARRQGQVVWPRQVGQHQGGMPMPCINPQMLGANTILPSTPASLYMSQSPSSSTAPFEALSSPVDSQSPADFASPSTSQHGLPSPASRLYTFSRTPSPFAMPNTAYLPAPDAYLYTGFESNAGSVPLSKTSIANKQLQAFNMHTPQPQVTISTPQTDMNSEWANFGSANDGDWQWLAAQMSLPGVNAAGMLPETNMNVLGGQALSGMNVDMGMGAQSM